VRCLEDESIEPTIIAEEAESHENVEDWKIELCTDRLKSMVADEDESF